MYFYGFSPRSDTIAILMDPLEFRFPPGLVQHLDKPLADDHLARVDGTNVAFQLQGVRLLATTGPLHAVELRGRCDVGRV